MTNMICPRGIAPCIMQIILCSLFREAYHMPAFSRCFAVIAFFRLCSYPGCTGNAYACRNVWDGMSVQSTFASLQEMSHFAIIISLNRCNILTLALAHQVSAPCMYSELV